MAMEDPILFTGKELNFEIPKMTELASAEQRLRDKITKQEDLQTKYQDEIRKNINIDTQALVSDFSRTQQYEAVKAFQDKWTKIAKERGNKLTPDDLMDMERDKAGISNLQNEWQSSQKLWEHDQALVKQSPGDFDIAKFTADTDAFLSTGQYKPNSLEFSGINMDDFFAGERWSGSMATTEDVIAGRDGFDTYTQKTVNATPDEAKKHILQVVLSDTTGRALKGIANDFMKESDDTKIKYLKDFDADNSGTISDKEMAAANVKMSSRNILTNPILAYAQDKYLPSVLKEKVVTDKRRRPNPPQGGATVSQSYVDENGVRVNISQRNVPASGVPTKAAGEQKPDEGIKPVGGKYTINNGVPPIDLGDVKEFMGIKKASAVKAYQYDPDTKVVKVTVYKKRGGATTVDMPIEDVLTMPDGDLKNSILDQVIQVDGKPVRLRELAGGDVEEKPKGVLDEL
jgi:hypothetical protein